MSGTFGYELDPGKLSNEDKEEIKKQIATFRKHYDLIQNGKYYRLSEIKEDYYEAWQFASEDGSEALLNVVVTSPQPNPTLMNIRLKGLEPGAVYEMTDESEEYHVESFYKDTSDNAGRRVFSGDALMNAGYTLPWAFGDYPAYQLHFRKIR